MAYKKFNISIDEELFEEIEKERAIVGLSRSGFFAEAAKAKIAERQSVEIIKANKEAYRDMLLQIADGLK